MVLIKDVMNIMEGFAPLNLAEEWDNCGLLVGDENHVVHKILIALEPSMEVIDYGIQEKVDLLITHHPLMLSKINKIRNNSLEGEKLIKLIKNDIGFYAAHTNLDSAPLGLNQYLADKIGLKECHSLNQSAGGSISGLGRIGILEVDETVEALGLRIKKLLNLDDLYYVGDRYRNIHKVALVTGSGLSELNKAIDEYADVFITGDVKYHQALYAKEMGIALIDATHFGSENIVIDLLRQLLEPKLPDVEILLDQNSNNPIKIL